MTDIRGETLKRVEGRIRDALELEDTREGHVHRLAREALRALIRDEDGRFDVPTELIALGGAEPGSVQSMFKVTIGGVLHHDASQGVDSPELTDKQLANLRPARRPSVPPVIQHPPHDPERSGLMIGTDNIIRRLHAAYQAARAANVEMREWRLSTTAHDQLIAEPQAKSLWGFDADVKNHRPPRRTLMGQPVVIEHRSMTTDEAMAIDDSDGTRQIPTQPVTICMAGIGRLGRWEYFDA